MKRKVAQSASTSNEGVQNAQRTEFYQARTDVDNYCGKMELNQYGEKQRPSRTIFERRAFF